MNEKQAEVMLEMLDRIRAASRAARATAREAVVAAKAC